MKIETFWPVFEASPSSTLTDVYGPSSLEGLRNLFLGGPPPLAIFTEREEAKAFALTQVNLARMRAGLDTLPDPEKA